MVRIEFSSGNMHSFVLEADCVESVFQSIKMDSSFMDKEVVRVSFSVENSSLLFFRVDDIDFNFDELYAIVSNIIKISELRYVDFADLLLHCIHYSKRNTLDKAYIFSADKQLMFFIKIIARNNIFISPVCWKYDDIYNIFVNLQDKHGFYLFFEDNRCFLSFNTNEKILSVVEYFVSFLLQKKLINTEEFDEVFSILSISFLRKFFQLSISLFHKRKDKFNIDLQEAIVKSLDVLESALNNFINGKILSIEEGNVIINALEKKGVFSDIPDYLYSSLHPIRHGFSNKEIFKLLKL